MNTLGGVERHRATALVIVFAAQLVLLPLHLAHHHGFEAHHEHAGHHASSQRACQGADHTDAEDQHGHHPHPALDHAVPMHGPRPGQAATGPVSDALAGPPTAFTPRASTLMTRIEGDEPSRPRGSAARRGHRARAPPAA